MNTHSFPDDGDTSGQRLRILFLINSLGAGGAERVLVNLVNRLDPARYDVTLRTLFDEGDNKERLNRSVGYEAVFRKSFRGVNILGKIPGRLVYNRVARGDFDVVVVYLHGVLTRIVASAPRGQATIAYLHANMENSPFIRGLGSQDGIGRVFDSYDAIVAVSRSVEESFRKVSGISERLHVIYNVFDTEAIRDRAAEQVPAGLLASPPVVNVCSVGKLTRVKGYDRLLRVAGRLQREGLTFNLLIVGEGPQRQELQDSIDEQGLSQCVTLLGYDENPYKYISRCDLFVSSSYSEGFSSVVVESMVLGVPVLATDCSGMREILGENDDYGMVVDNSDSGLRDGLRQLIGDPGLLTAYRARAATRAVEFEPGNAVAAFEELVASVMSRGS